MGEHLRATAAFEYVSDTRVLLTIVRNGCLAAENVAVLEEPQGVRFDYYYASTTHLSQLGILPGTKSFLINRLLFHSERLTLMATFAEFAAGVSPRATVASAFDLASAADPSNAFLRLTNSLLLSILTPAQQALFLRKLAASESLEPHLSPAYKDDLAAMIQRLTASATQSAERRNTEQEQMHEVATTQAQVERLVTPKRTTSSGGLGLGLGLPPMRRYGSPVSMEHASPGKRSPYRTSSIRSPQPKSPRKKAGRRASMVSLEEGEVREEKRPRRREPIDEMKENV